MTFECRDEDSDRVPDALAEIGWAGAAGRHTALDRCPGVLAVFAILAAWLDCGLQIPSALEMALPDELAEYEDVAILLETAIRFSRCF